MDSHLLNDDDDDDEQELKPTFRIRFTIGNNNNNNNNSSSSSLNNFKNLCNANHCNRFLSNDCQKHNCNHIIEIERKEKTNQKTTNIETNKLNKKKLFELIEPQNHKSSLFVNLSDTNSSLSSEDKKSETHLFISPDLNQLNPPSPVESNSLSDTYSSCFDNTTNFFTDNNSTLEDSSPKSFSNFSSSPPTEYLDKNLDDTMSNGCNFLNTLMSDSRRRSASVTRPSFGATNSTNNNNNKIPKNLANDVVNNGRRASSSNDLVVPTHNALSGNKTKTASTETICDTDSTQTNKNLNTHNSIVRPQSVNNNRNLRQSMMQPIEINISTDEDDPDYAEFEILDEQEQHRHYQQNYYPTSISRENEPISLSDILAIDIDSLRLQDECKNLEDQVEIMEQRVDELERKRFGDDVPRTLVESVLNQRRRLRELEFQIYKLSLDSETTDKFSHEGELVSPIIDSDDSNDNSRCFLDCNHHHHQQQQQQYYSDLQDNNKISGRYGSQLKPGQENTADILNAIPPSGSLQHKQYLNKALTGTDTSEYSQLPLFNYHRHHLPSLQNVSPVFFDDGQDNSNNIQSNQNLESLHHHHHYHHHQHHQHRHNNQHQKERHDQSSPRHHHRSRRAQTREQPVYAQLIEHKVRGSNSENRSNNYKRSSPIRPDHFKDEFKTHNNVNNISQDSASSTASSSSPH